MATLKQLQDKANPILADFWTLLQSKQDAYYAKHGKYFQLLVSPESPVVDGMDSDFSVRKPSDEKFALDVDVPWSEKIPFQIQVNEWVGPQGAGYEAQVWVQYQGKTYSRHRDNAQNDSGWFEVIEEEI